MSQPPPPPDPFPTDSFGSSMSYESHAVVDPVDKRLRLAVIFNYISCGLDLLLAVGAIAMAALAGFALSRKPPEPEDPPAALVYAVYGGVGILALCFAIVKFIGTRKLQSQGPTSRAWGMTIGIIGCVQLVCGCCFLLQPAAGIYTLVIVSMEETRIFLQRKHSPQDLTA